MDPQIIDILLFIAFFTFITTLGGLVLWKLFDMVKNSINKNKSIYDEETFERLAEAFIKHKKESEKRFQNLEAIIADENHPAGNQLEEPKRTIEIEDEKERGSKSDSGNLSNMLHE